MKEMKNSLHLTLSIIFKNQDQSVLDKILSIQKTLCSKLITSNKIQENVIYTYPKNTIHNSLVDFKPAIPFRNKLEIDSFKKENKEIIYKITTLATRLKKNVKDNRVTIKGIYFEPTKSNSIALQIYPSKDILKFAKNLKNSFSQIDKYPIVKGHPANDPQYFSINLIRWLRPLTKSELEILNNNKANIKTEIGFNFEINKFSLVVSDDYLSNINPEVAEI